MISLQREPAPQQQILPLQNVFLLQFMSYPYHLIFSPTKKQGEEATARAAAAAARYRETSIKKPKRHCT